MKHGTLALLVCFSALLATVIAGIADDKHPTEAPSGFTTPSFDGQNSVSNGFLSRRGTALRLTSNASKSGTTLRRDWGRCITQRLASIAIRTP